MLRFIMLLIGLVVSVFSIAMAIRFGLRGANAWDQRICNKLNSSFTGFTGIFVSRCLSVSSRNSSTLLYLETETISAHNGGHCVPAPTSAYCFSLPLCSTAVLLKATVHCPQLLKMVSLFFSLPVQHIGT